MLSFSQLATRTIYSAALLLSASIFASAATVTVTPTVTSIAGGYQYAYSISYTGTDDAFLIDISVPKTPTSVSSLTAPAGFTTAFDSVLGLASFLESTGSFTSTPTAGFVFDSPYAPGTTSFTASVLGANGISSITGSTLAPTLVPEPSTFFLLALLAPILLVIKFRKKAASGVALLSVAGSLMASSHSDAPLIKQDPQANLTDVYAFVGTKYNDASTKVLNIVVNVHPFSEPGDGGMYDRFAPDALFSINIANPNTGAVLTTYNFQYSAVSSAAGAYKNLGTILSYGRGTSIGAIQHTGDSAQNFTQSYTVTKVSGGSSSVIGSNLLVPPPNVGMKTTPLYNNASGIAVSGATTNAGLDTYTKETIYALNSGEVVWSGPREDSFFGDTPGIFDLLEARILGSDGHGQTGNGVDGFKGYNVLTFALQVPIASLPSIAYTDAFTGASHGVGVYASVSRPRITLLNASGDATTSGPWIQVNRLGNPLFNEVLVALKDKDNYNRDVPTNDAKYATYAQNPEVAVLINAVFGTSLATTGRADLAAVYIPDVLRVDTTTDPVPLIGAGGNRLSGLGGDTTSGKWSGWPNGRRFGDDVIDIALTAVASGPTYSSIFLLGDNINHNDQTYNFVFPYAATPWAGPTNRKDPGN